MTYLKGSIKFMSVIGIDLGGTKLASALFADEGEIVFKEIIPLEKRSGKELGALITGQTIKLLEKASELKLPVTALGICVPGIAYQSTGNVWAPNIPGWDNYPLLDEMKRSLKNYKLDVKIDSDRACYILGEVWKGNAINCDDAIFLAVGTGIGAGILANGKILRGSNDIAGAVGWMALDRPYQKKYSSCGCFEYHASGPGIAKVTKEYISSGLHPGSILNNKNLDEISARDVFEAFDSGDALGKIIIGNAIECWGMTVANLVSLFNPEKIILGGGVFGPALKFIEDIYEEARKWAQPISIRQVKLEASALGNDAGLYGAGYLALKN